jgi:hypothetical protein
MVFLAVTIVIALALVPLTGGSFRRLGKLQFTMLWLLLLAFAIQIPLDFVSFPKERIDDLGVGLLLLSYVMIFVFCWVNRRVKGMLIITIGIALNVLVIALNQGMPAKDDVVTRNGREVHVPIERTVKHRPREDGDLLPFLSDVITLPEVPNQQFSIGDIVISLGIIDLAFEESRRPRRRGARVSEEIRPA